MKKFLLILLLLLTGSRVAMACGGPEMYPISWPLAPLSDHLSQIVLPTDHFGDAYPLPQILFLYPYQLSAPEKTTDLWPLFYDSCEEDENQISCRPPYTLEEISRADWDGKEKPPIIISKLSEDGFADRLAKGTPDAATKEAQSIIHAILDMPVVQANLNRRLFNRAIEFLELASTPDFKPSVWSSYFASGSSAKPVAGFVRHWTACLKRAAGDPRFLTLPLVQARMVRDIDRSKAGEFLAQHPDNPRAGTLRFIALQESMKKNIPDGWREEIQKQMSSQAWQQLLDLHEAWLKDFPDHPLSDLVRLSEVRLAYLKGDNDAAWKILFILYPRLQNRTLSEMRFLLKQGMKPVNLPIKALDPLLVSALVPSLDLNAGQWNAAWSLSLQHPGQKWAVNLQERLLYRAQSLIEHDKKLPAQFPSSSGNPTPLWGKLRLLGLIAAGAWGQAKDQINSMKPDADSAVLMVKVYLHNHDWAQAVTVGKLDPQARRYLIRVLFDDKTLDELSRIENKDVQKEALLGRAVREAADGHWEEGARLLQGWDPKRAELWKKADALQKAGHGDGWLTLARFLKANDGKLFFPQDRVWYRSIFLRLSCTVPDPHSSDPSSLRDLSLPWDDDTEQSAVMKHLTGSELYLALQAYGEWFKKPGSEKTGTVIREADEVYNKLVNWANNYCDSWQDFLKNSEAAKLIRAGGLKKSG